MNLIMKWMIGFWTIYWQVGITNHNVESRDSKEENIKPLWGTKGLPKVSKDYGNRGTIILRNYKYLTIQGRVPGNNVRYNSTSAGSSSTVSTDGVEKLRKIAKLCSENPNFIVNDKLYRLLYDKQLYQIAYNKLKSKPGNMTLGIGIVPTTLDGMSIEVIEEIIRKLREGTFNFKPGRRIQIPKANEKLRPLTIAPPRDKLVQECIRMILEAIYEPSFSDNSHGFRPNRSCHTALKTIRQKFGDATWLIEGDIAKCFDSIDHRLLLKILEERIKDYRFIEIIRKSLKAGYFEFRRFSHSIAGTPQGSIISPILANIFLDKLDKFIEDLKKDFDIGTKASTNPIWNRLKNKKQRTNNLEERKLIHKQLIKLPSKSPIDLNFKKLMYVRYADDWIIAVRGSKLDCINILKKIKQFLENELKLELSSEKTLITNTKSETALFLSTRIMRAQHETFRKIKKYPGMLIRNNKILRMTAPIDTVTMKLKLNGFIKENEPSPRFLWMQCTKDEIILLYNSVYRGIIQYYRFADNFNNLSAKVHYILKESCVKLLAAKLSLKTQAKVFKAFGKNLKGKDKHAFVSIILGLNPIAFNVQSDDQALKLFAKGISKASLEGLQCSICDSEFRVEMHHIRMLKDIDHKKSLVERIMISRKRKQIPLCRNCHMKHYQIKF